MENCKLENYASQNIGQKMITPQECLQVKRGMEAQNDDFEASPLALCLMITLLLFGICLWVWLISWSCFFGDSVDKNVSKDKNKDNKDKDKDKDKDRDKENTRLSGGISNKSHNKDVRLTNNCNKKKSNISIRTQLLRNLNPISDVNQILQPRVYQQGGRTSFPTGESEMEVSGPPRAYGATASNLAKEDPKAPKKYKIQWTKLFKLSRSGESNN